MGQSCDGGGQGGRGGQIAGEERVDLPGELAQVVHDGQCELGHFAGHVAGGRQGKLCRPIGEILQ